VHGTGASVLGWRCGDRSAEWRMQSLGYWRFGSGGGRWANSWRSDDKENGSVDVEEDRAG